MFSTQQRFLLLVQSSEQTIMAVELYSCAQQHTVAAAPSAPSPALAHVSPRSQDADVFKPPPVLLPLLLRKDSGSTVQVSEHRSPG